MPDAYNYYTQARGYLQDASKTADVDSAIILLEQALKVDPNYGRAEADMGSADWAKYTSSKDKSLIAKSRQACRKRLNWAMPEPPAMFAWEPLPAAPASMKMPLSSSRARSNWSHRTKTPTSVWAALMNS